MKFGNFIDRALRLWWRRVKSGWLNVAESVLLIYLLSAFALVSFSVAAIYASTHYPAASLVIWLMFLVLAFFTVSAAISFIAIDVVEGRKSGIWDVMYRAIRAVPKVVAYYAVVVIFTVLSALLLFIPVLLAYPYIISSYFLILRGYGVFEAIGKSWKMLEGKWFEAWVAMIAPAVVSQAGRLWVVGSPYAPNALGISIIIANIAISVFAYLLLKTFSQAFQYSVLKQYMV